MSYLMKTLSTKGREKDYIDITLQDIANTIEDWIDSLKLYLDNDSTIWWNETLDEDNNEDELELNQTFQRERLSQVFPWLNAYTDNLFARLWLDR